MSRTSGTGASVVSLWRHPVKSMMGEELRTADLTERGLLSDRAYALVDSATGEVVSAKNPHCARLCSTTACTWGCMPRLNGAA